MENVQAQIRRAVRLREAGDYPAAVSVLASLDVGREDVAYQIGWVFDCMNRDREAIEYYERAVQSTRPRASEGELPPHDRLGALLGLGTVLVRSGRAERAAQVLQSAVMQFPQSDQAAALLTLALNRMESARSE